MIPHFKTSFRLLALVATSSAFAAPSIFWTSSPVRPDETVYLQGDELTKSVKVEYARLPDENPGTGPASESKAALEWKAVAPIQAAGGSLQFVVPKGEKAGAFRLRLNGGGKTTEGEFNLPEVWWTQGEGGRGQAYTNGWLRVFGRSLQLNDTPAAYSIRAGDKTLFSGTFPPGDGYSLNLALPKDLPAGSYALFIHNGFGGPTAWRPAGSFTVTAPPAWPDKRFSVLDYGVIPNDQKDDAAGLQAALDAAGKAGGGEVFLPRGRYMVSVGLTIPRQVTLRGESQVLTAMQWYDYGVGIPKPNVPEYIKQGSPPLALISGDSYFRVQDLTIYAWSHFHGILAQHWKGEGNVHLKNVLMRLNETSVNFGRFYAEKSGELDSEFNEFQARRARRKGLWTAAFQAGGPNISVENCDFEDDGSGIIIDHGDGVVIRNSRFRTAFSKGTQAMILEDNKLSEFWPGTHDSSQDPLRRWKLGERVASASTQYLYMARNSSKNADGDREPCSLDSHGPFGVYLGPVQADGRTLTIEEVAVSGQKSPKKAPVGYGVYILDGKGAGQFRRVTAGEGLVLEMDRPFDVPPDKTSTISIAKYHGELLYIDNDFTDTGDIQIWGGAVHTVFKGTQMTRTGGFNQAGGFIFGGIIPIWYLEQFDTRVIEGNSPGGPPFILRDTRLSMNTYRHAEFYQGPCVRGGVIRRTVAENNTRLEILGAVRGALIEHATIENADVGINISSRASYYNDPQLEKERRTPEDIVLRAITFKNVDSPLTGDAVKNFPIQP